MKEEKAPDYVYDLSLFTRFSPNTTVVLGLTSESLSIDTGTINKIIEEVVLLMKKNNLFPIIFFIVFIIVGCTASLESYNRESCKSIPDDKIFNV